jgi:hypothetical protein
LLRLEGGVFAWDEETKSIALEEIEDALRTAVDAAREDLCADALVKVRPTQRPVSITLTFVPLAKVAGCAPHRLLDGAPDTDCATREQQSVAEEHRVTKECLQSSEYGPFHPSSRVPDSTDVVVEAGTARMASATLVPSVGRQSVAHSGGGAVDSSRFMSSGFGPSAV